MPSFGKRTPLTLNHFKEFEKCYGKKPDGTNKRKQGGDFLLDSDGSQSEESEFRFRCFTRKYVSERGDNLDISRHGGEYWRRWIEFILNAIWRSERLVQLREKYREALKQDGAPTRLFDVVDGLFSMPAINMAERVKNCGVSKPTALKDIERLETLGMLEEYTGKSRDRDWVCREIIHVIEQEGPEQ